MDFVLYIFKRGFHHYLVPAESEDNAWEILRQKQSCRLEIAKKQYKLIKFVTANDGVIKL
ncbi:MAG: hypothetical protein AABY15_02895 [Nanoarchaeota archaeon]